MEVKVGDKFRLINEKEYLYTITKIYRNNGRIFCEVSWEMDEDGFPGDSTNYPIDVIETNSNWISLRSDRKKKLEKLRNHEEG